MAKAVVVCSDLMFSTRITGTAKALGWECVLAPSAAAAEAHSDGDCVIVDLACPGVPDESLAQLRRVFSIPTRLIAFGSHVEVDRLKAARQAGFDLVLARSEFTNRLAELFGASAMAPRTQRP